MPRARIAALAIAASLALAACAGAASPTTAPASPAASVAAPGTASPAASQAPAASHVITIQDFAFAPVTLTITAGTTVTWDNADAVTHSVKWDAGTPGSAPLGHDGTYARTFTTPGTYAYVCGIHSSMTGTIVVH